MKADTKFATAIHICLYLQYRGEKLLSSQEMAASVDTNPVVIRRVLADLRKKDIVGSVAGSQGGFYLKRSIDKINLWDIYQAVNDRELFQRPKVNEECPVSSNLAHLLKLPFQTAEQGMRPGLEKITVSALYAELKDILKTSSKFC
ncbi:Rrf2 family transcriptional regulator [Olivibacter sp. XZL3]|uniref:Rrf2 family transcriptional regulator n=1 Tax=Olivibacter sp. XZL3 TaxID=1735116 RepID=UPI0010666EA3|nr:Rrf2 family transcriptional regulator [Olivibacter sp. XZL3]